MSFVLLALVAFGLAFLGRRKGFFDWTPASDWNVNIRLWHVLAAFAIYFAIWVFGSSVYAPVIKALFSIRSSPIGLTSWLVFLLSLTIAAGLWIYATTLPPTVRSGLWRQSAKPHRLQDVKNAAIAFCIGMPAVLLLGHVLEWLVEVGFGVSEVPDQSAVYFLKMTFQHPTYFLLATLSVVVLAPLIEETLFRGFLQSFIRKHLGTRHAITITAVCFSFFHYAPEQGLANIPIIGSLFAFALFLGFVYEKQRSLFASISLHALFNGFSALSLYLFGECSL